MPRPTPSERWRAFVDPRGEDRLRGTTNVGTTNVGTTNVGTTNRSSTNRSQTGDTALDRASDTGSRPYLVFPVTSGRAT